jgi:alkylhydroperoxidase family enzyme
MSKVMNLKILVLLAGLFLPSSLIAAPPREGTGRTFPLLSNAECWRKLPPAVKGAGLPLPSWARVTAAALPRTTAGMLRMDYVHRTRNPLGPVLRGKMRWVAASANRCEYTMAYAEADLQSAVSDDAALRSLKGDFGHLPERERAALEFARQMTEDASKVTDEDVARLLALYGEEKVVAMVLLLAHANYQDRLVLALGCRVEPGGPISPLDIQFDTKADPPAVPPRKPPEGRPVPDEPTRVSDPFWLSLAFDDLQDRLTDQRERPSRIRVPSFEEYLRVLPPEMPRPERPVQIKWNLVTMGYQPELATAWSNTTRAFRQEAKQDRVFEESLFWIVTRTIHCFY